MSSIFMTSTVRAVVALGLMMWLLARPSPVAAQTETVEYYATDAIGSVRVVFDASGNVLGRMDYAPFGEELYTGLFLPSQRFAQLTRDGESGKDSAEARMYRPDVGTFNRPDPVYAGVFDPQRWNRYTYALANPMRFTDPTGLCPDCPTDYIYTETVIVKGTFLNPSGGGRPGATDDVTTVAQPVDEDYDPGSSGGGSFSDPFIPCTTSLSGLCINPELPKVEVSIAGVPSGPGGASAAGHLIKQGYRSFSAFKRAFGSAGYGSHWHHIVEQTRNNIARFGAEAIHHTQNLVRLPARTNIQLNALYSSIRPDITGSSTLTVRQWLSTQSYPAQTQFGLAALKNIVSGMW